jgi:hypothetical protein
MQGSIKPLELVVEWEETITTMPIFGAEARGLSMERLWWPKRAPIRTHISFGMEFTGPIMPTD